MHERDLISYLEQNFPRPPDSLTWMDGDCEILRFEGELLLVNVDTSTEYRDFPIEAPDEEIGYFCTSLSISDIAACGGIPMGILVSCCIPQSYDTRILNIYDGIQEAAKDAEINILGGDTNASDEFGLSVVTIGTAKEKQLLRRKTAQLGDIVGVTGVLSRFNEGFTAYNTSRTEAIDYTRMLKQPPPVEKGLVLASLGSITSCIDLPDGLVKSLNDNMPENAGYIIYGNQIPVEMSSLYEYSIRDNYELASYPAGDIELLFTASASSQEQIESAFIQEDLEVHWIGEVISKSGIYIETEHGTVTPEDPGFLHEFKEGPLFRP